MSHIKHGLEIGAKNIMVSTVDTDVVVVFVGVNLSIFYSSQNCNSGLLLETRSILG